MTRLPTSFANLFGQQQPNQPVVDSIEIPLIQRDYAQGRTGRTVERIRADFLAALCDAVMSADAAISLDFVYGDVKDGTLFPLDGQQRLTTLFLFHWYLAWRSGKAIDGQRWTKFSYATRAGARRFCECLASFQPPTGESRLSAWLKDQAWYLHTWQHDPTVQSMLVMLDALHARLASSSQEDCIAAWGRLTDAQRPAISFHLLPMESYGLTDDLYIKMNSRGKPLTAFENFKAHFEALLLAVHPASADDFAKKVDVDWADILWSYRGDDNLIDDEFMRYFRFVAEVSAWQSGVAFDGNLDTDALALQVYGDMNAAASTNLAFLFDAFDAWKGIGIKSEFERMFRASRDAGTVDTGMLLMFNAFKSVSEGISPVDLFAGCCRGYGRSEWDLSHTLLLYAVLLHRMHGTDQFPRRLRVLRNLVEASAGNEIRSAKMADLLADVRRIVVDGTVRDVVAFNQNQVANELDKAALLERYPTLQPVLHRLEDHDILRGCLSVFDFDELGTEQVFRERAAAFHVVFDKRAWADVTGALLALGDYSRRELRWTGYRACDFGVASSARPWRDLFSGKKKQALISTVMALLDRISEANYNLACLESIQAHFVEQCATLDWRYYFVRYPVMRSGASGRYVMNASGYGVCMLDKTVMRSNYHDPYLLAVLHASRVGEAVVTPKFYGYETEPRRLVLSKSGIEIECVDSGWQLGKPPADPARAAAYTHICNDYGIDGNGLYRLKQSDGVDTEDRVAAAARLLKSLVDAGL